MLFIEFCSIIILILTNKKNDLMKNKKIIVTLIAFCSTYSFANQWVDDNHAMASTTLDSWANSVDGWFGETDPDDPASAVLRIMLDNSWNRYDGYSIKPRIRGKLRLPTLKRRFSLVFGDDSLDNEITQNHLGKNYSKPLDKDKIYDSKQSRDDNKSLALRWSESIKDLGITFKIDLGIRSGQDIYLRFKGDKEWIVSENLTSYLEGIYRLGTKSKHHVNVSWNNKYTETDNRNFGNQIYVGYTNDLTSEHLYWGDSIYRQHNYSNHRRLNYGVFVGGTLSSNDKTNSFVINRYGPYINWRQPIWKKWVFIEPEINFYNDRDMGRKHTLGGFLRLEAIF